MAHSNGKVCCAANCGSFCGADNCNIGPGGPYACCSSTIKSNGLECGSNGQKAPCTLGSQISYLLVHACVQCTIGLLLN